VASVKRTPLRRKTPLRAKKRINARSPRNDGLPLRFREEAWAQSHGRCDLCGEPIVGGLDNAVVHHAYFKSHIRPPLGHQLWNRSLLHRHRPDCHSADSSRATPHNAMHARWKLEDMAFGRLMRMLSQAEIDEMYRLAAGTSQRLLVRGYELMRRAQRTLHAGKM
jgi:5-methylcytosine-specific restriction endonuclease McrA